VADVVDSLWIQLGRHAIYLLHVVLLIIVQGPMAWVVVAEIWPLSVRGKGVSIGASSNWVKCSETSSFPSTIAYYVGADEQFHCWTSHPDDADQHRLRHVFVRIFYAHVV
jgi:hypothetical protein